MDSSSLAARAADAPGAAGAGLPPSGEETRRRGMRAAIYGQSSGYVAHLAFSNGLILLYLNARQMSSALALVLLSLPELLLFLLLLPSAYYADRLGIKRLGTPGLILATLGFAALPLSGFLETPAAAVAVAAGTVVYGAGYTLFNAGWYALMGSLVPAETRGRFFGTLRFSWQISALVFGGLCSLTLGENWSMGAFQVVLLALTVGLAARIGFYARIPQYDPPRPDGPGLKAAVARTLGAGEYVSFCCYVFLLALFTSSCPALFTLVQKKALGLGDDTVVWLGNAQMLGSLLGFLLGGRAVDRVSTKSVFLTCHFAFGLILVLYVARGLVPLPAALYLGALNFLFGLAYAASSIAISTETIAQLPGENRSLAASLCISLVSGGRALSGLLSAWALKLGLLSESWQLWGTPLSAYDSLLLGCAVMVVLLVVTLGLVPSVLRRKE